MASDKQSTNADTPDTTGDSSADAVDSTRRTVLKGVAAAGLAAPLASGNVSADHGTYADRFGTVVDMVDAGADPDGDESITSVIKEHADDDTVLYFPEGRYYMDEQVRFTGFKNFGIVGNGATIVPANYWDFKDDGGKWRLFRLGIYYNESYDLLFEGFTIDQSADDTGVRVLEADVNDGLEVRDIEIVGQHDSGVKGPGRFCVNDPDGTGVVENFRAPDGGEWVQNTPNDGNLWRGPSGITCNEYHRGDITFQDCALGGFPDNGLYAIANGPDSGTVRVHGGYYENSEAASIRLGGVDSYIEGATVEVNENREYDTNQVGIRLEHGDVGIWSTDVRITAPNGNAVRTIEPDSVWIATSNFLIEGDVVSHGINVSPRTGRFTINDIDIEINTRGGAAIRLEDAGSDPEKVVIEEATVHGNAGHEINRSGIWSNRANVEFRKLDVDQTGGELRRAVTHSGKDALIYDSNLRGRDTAFYNEGDGAWFESNYAETESDNEAIRLIDGSGITIKYNEVENGIDLDGVDDYRAWGNKYF